MRDWSIVHRGEKDSAIGLRCTRIGIHLRYKKEQKTTEKFISSREIDVICENVYRFLKDLNEFLCKNFDYLPLEIRERKN
jgi:hypothetical protein